MRLFKRQNKPELTSRQSVEDREFVFFCWAVLSDVFCPFSFWERQSQFATAALPTQAKLGFWLSLLLRSPQESKPFIGTWLASLFECSWRPVRLAKSCFICFPYGTMVQEFLLHTRFQLYVEIFSSFNTFRFCSV